MSNVNIYGTSKTRRFPVLSKFGYKERPPPPHVGKEPSIKVLKVFLTLKLKLDKVFIFCRWRISVTAYLDAKVLMCLAKY